MSLCQKCGLVSYPNLYKNEEAIKSHYRTDYRTIPKIANFYTGSRKIHFHEFFLRDTIEEIQKRTDQAVIGEVGAAMGMLLNWLRTFFPKGDISGTELTTSYRRVAYHEYGLKLTEDFDLSKKYDLIISYKVAEHQMDVDKRLREYAEALKPEGYLYISVPTWFSVMSNFGLPGFDLEYYYDTNHINVWTRKLFESLLKKSGLEIVKYDGVIYDDTYLCRRNDELMKVPPELENPDDIERRMANIILASKYFTSDDTSKAIETWPNFPDAWAKHYEKNRQDPHKQRENVDIEYLMDRFHKPMVEACGETFETHRLAADICMRYDLYERALEYWQKAIYCRPGSGYCLGPISHCFRRLADMEKDPKSKEALRRKAAEVTKHWIQCDIESRPEAMNWLYFDQSKIPLPD